MPKLLFLALLLTATAAALPIPHPPALPGLAETNLTANFKASPANLRFSTGQQMRTVYSRCAKGHYGGNLITVWYDRLDDKVVMVSAQVVGRDAVSGQKFLSALASIPIQGVSPAAVRDWVERTYPLARQDQPAEKLFGNVNFELIGHKGAVSLKVLHKDYAAWALKRLK